MIRKWTLLERIVAERLYAAPSWLRLVRACAADLRAFCRTGLMPPETLNGYLSELQEQIDTEPWILLRHHARVSNAYSQRARTLKRLARQVIDEAALVTAPPGEFRGDGECIDWDIQAAAWGVPTWLEDQAPLADPPQSQVRSPVSVRPQR